MHVSEICRGFFFYFINISGMIGPRVPGRQTGGDLGADFFSFFPSSILFCFVCLFKVFILLFNIDLHTQR